MEGLNGHFCHGFYPQERPKSLFFCSNSTCPAWYNLFVCQQILPAIGISADLPEEKTRPFKSRIRPFCVGKRPFNADPFPDTFFQSRFSSGLPSSGHPKFLHIRSKVRQARMLSNVASVILESSVQLPSGR